MTLDNSYVATTFPNWHFLGSDQNLASLPDSGKTRLLTSISTKWRYSGYQRHQAYKPQSNRAELDGTTLLRAGSSRSLLFCLTDTVSTLKLSPASFPIAPMRIRMDRAVRPDLPTTLPTSRKPTETAKVVELWSEEVVAEILTLSLSATKACTSKLRALLVFSITSAFVINHLF